MALKDLPNKKEVRIAGKLLGRALAKGYAISVYDSEDIALERSKDRAAIVEAMASTGSDHLFFYQDCGAGGFKYLGWVRLIWGNGEDLISDNTIGAEIEALVKGL